MVTMAVIPPSLDVAAAYGGVSMCFNSPHVVQCIDHFMLYDVV
jgi:hypothetical protein